MPSSSAPRRGRLWPWAVPVTLVVLVAAVGGGLSARALYGESGAEPSEPNSTTSAPATQGRPGPAVVELAPGAAEHPDHRTVRSMLQILFYSINANRYDQWRTTVVEERQRTMPEDEWRDAYGSTRDGSILVHTIRPGPDDSVRVLLSFTSVQDPADAPSEMPVDCLRWHVVYPLVKDSGGLRLDTNLPGSSQYSPC
ncbi:hypothetical protein [Allosaccharopolyspora coralli]|uniref:hypothetical protein n=1 Tax=Allosaccharopolyspora coralli TaxID=2665642 RepID=UPI001E523C89|nr:hypothetical protein [Allosaccharopolyspora coralli]